jgi:hypothetical protein
MFAVSALSEIRVKATQITGLAAGQEYLRFFFNPVGCDVPQEARVVASHYLTHHLPDLSISLAMILRCFQFTVVPGTRIDRSVAISMNPRHGLPMIVAKQDRNYSVSEVRGQIRETVHFPSNGSG